MNVRLYVVSWVALSPSETTFTPVHCDVFPCKIVTGRLDITLTNCRWRKHMGPHVVTLIWPLQDSKHDSYDKKNESL